MRFLPVILTSLVAAHAFAIDDYKLGPDAQPQEVPHGEVKRAVFDKSHIFPCTTHDYWVYVPKQYDAAKPACLMVFFDGAGYVRVDGNTRVPVVFDNLIAKKEMPVTIGVFVQPGNIKASEAPGKDRSNRSFEYDSLGDANARFLIEELLPEATKGLNITPDPNGHAIAGLSSGAIAAFTVAWERPDQFHKVVSWIGSFTNIRGGYVYPALIRKSKDPSEELTTGSGQATAEAKAAAEAKREGRKALRVFLQDGANDLDNLHGNWPLSNQDMAAALKFAGYDYQFEFGDGGHSGKHGSSLFPDTMRWLWRDWPKE